VTEELDVEPEGARDVWAGDGRADGIAAPPDGGAPSWHVLGASRLRAAPSSKSVVLEVPAPAREP